MDEQKPSFTLSTINPPWVFGPSVSGSSLGHLNGIPGSCLEIDKWQHQGNSLTNFAGFADVRDLAKAHLLAYETEEAGGQIFARQSLGLSDRG
jgi:NADPH-dependent methylglyoxal reductase